MNPTIAIRKRKTPQAIIPPTMLRLAITAAAFEYVPTLIRIMATTCK